jgi:hypothetical protein
MPANILPPPGVSRTWKVILSYYLSISLNSFSSGDRRQRWGGRYGRWHGRRWRLHTIQIVIRFQLWIWWHRMWGICFRLANDRADRGLTAGTGGEGGRGKEKGGHGGNGGDFSLEEKETKYSTCCIVWCVFDCTACDCEPGWMASYFDCVITITNSHQ